MTDEGPVPSEAIPALRLSVEDARPAEHAAVPTLVFALRVQVADEQPIRSILLDVQIQIAARRRPYGQQAQERLLELFGTADRWGSTLRTLPWTRTTLVVPPFAGSTVVEVPVACSYDLEVSASRYFAALEDGEVPLELFFSGTVFFSGVEGGLQASRIAWDLEAGYRLPVSVWRETMDRHFPHTAWLRLDRERFDRLCAYKARHAFESWDVAIDALLEGAGR